MAELTRPRTRNKNKVHVQPEPEPVISKNETEQILTIPTKESPIEADTDNIVQPTTTELTTTTQIIVPSSEPTASKERNKLQIQKARELASQGQYNDAIDIFDRVLPPTYDSLYYRGCARLELGKQTDIYNAIKDFNEALNLLPVPNDLNIYYKRAFACQLIGRYPEAIIDYTMFIERTQDDTRYIGYLNRGLIYGEVKQYHKALEDIESANGIYTRRSKYYIYCLARAQASAGNNNEAKEIFSKLVNICRDEYNTTTEPFDTHFYYGIALHELVDYINALKEFQEALKHSRNNRDQLETRFYIGLTYYALGNIEAAKAELQEVVTSNENHTRALFRLGLIESLNDNSQGKALNYLTQAHKLSPHKSDILYERGELYYKMGQVNACIRDKQLALQLQPTDGSRSTIKHYCELLLQRLLSVLKQEVKSANMSLLLILLYDKIHLLSRDTTRTSIYEKDYRNMILMYEREIDKNESSIYLPIYFALLHNLHQYHKHPGAALIALEQLHDRLDKQSDLQQSWDAMLTQLRELATTENTSQLANLQVSLGMTNKDILKLQTDQSNQISLSLLLDRLTVLEKIEENRQQVRVDRGYFKQDDDENKNRLKFYEKLRISLSHKFTSMAVVSGDDQNEPIVKHDVTGTETMIADGICLLGETIGDNMPISGGGAVSAVAGFLGNRLKEHEYNRYQERMAFVTDVGTIEELTDVARRIARRLADSYKKQFISLDRRSDENVACCSCCCPWLQKEKKDDPTVKKRQVKVLQPAEQLAQLAVAYAVQAIIDGKLENIPFTDDTKCEDLAKTLTQLISCAEPNIKDKVLKRLNINKNGILPRKPFENTIKQGEKIDKWHLCDFYWKPGISIQIEDKTEDQEPLSWMNPDIYGYRLGTIEEYNNLKEHDKKQIKDTAKWSCC